MNMDKTGKASLERGSQTKTDNEVVQLYEVAIAEFERQQLYLYKAYALERVGDFCMSCGEKMEEQGHSFLRKSYAAYEVYGALIKLPLLCEAYPEVETWSSDDKEMAPLDICCP